MNCKVLVVFIVACLTTGYALECYQCKGKDDKCVDIDTDKVDLKKCEGRKYIHMFPEDFLPDSTTDLDAGTSQGTRADKYYCLKTSTTVNGVTSMYRSCIKDDVGDFEENCKDASEGGVEFTCAVCTEDKCNSSYAIVPSIIVSVAMLFIGKLL